MTRRNLSSQLTRPPADELGQPREPAEAANRFRFLRRVGRHLAEWFASANLLSSRLRRFTEGATLAFPAPTVTTTATTRNTRPAAGAQRPAAVPPDSRAVGKVAGRVVSNHEPPAGADDPEGKAWF